VEGGLDSCWRCMISADGAQTSLIRLDGAGQCGPVPTSKRGGVGLRPGPKIEEALRLRTRLPAQSISKLTSPSSGGDKDISWEETSSTMHKTAR
jgi:hypothetical protein